MDPNPTHPASSGTLDDTFTPPTAPRKQLTQKHVHRSRSRLNNHAFFVITLRVLDFMRRLKKYPLPPLQGKTIQVPLEWFGTTVRAISITTG
jgi:hypothetical protein